MNNFTLNFYRRIQLLTVMSLIIICFSPIYGQTSLGPWNPVLYPAVTGTPGWEVQDNMAAGTTSDPFASWSRVVDAIEAGGINQNITILPDAFIESYDYDNDGSAESTLGHNLATELNITSAQNGLVIDGSTQGCYTVFDNTSNGSGSLFGTIGGADNITIRGLYLLNGYAGAFNITNSTNVTFEDCIFDNNDLNGVEVFNITAGTGGSSITFTRCQFINNNHVGIVHNVNRPSGNGTIDLDFNDCVWSCNSATSGGTAMKVTNGDTGGITLDFSACTFAGNSSTGAQGGAIWLDGAETTTTFTNTNFINNQITGGTGGGALFIGTNDNVTMTGCNFYGNSSTSLSADGGAIYAFSGSSGVATLNITNATFDSNSAVDDGGAICMRYANVTLNNIHVQNNTAGDGIITTANSAANCTATNISCNLNSAPDGCLYQRSGTLTDNGGAATGSPVDLSSAAPSYACGVYCAINIPATCVANNGSSAICAASGNLNISGEVWEDINGNGIQEAGDNGIANAFVLLYDSNSNLIGRTNADGTGMYSFSGLPSGSYYLVFVNPDTATHPEVAPANAGTESTDSDITDSTTNQTDMISSSTTDLDGAFTSVILPVSLVQFSGKKMERTVELNWLTDQEFNNEGFVIERKSTNNDWIEIGYTRGNGNSNTTIQYQFIDTKPNEGVNNYRLKQMDFDGAFAYSSVVSVRYSGQELNAHFYPSPANDDLFIDIESKQSGAGKLEIYDCAGKQIQLINLDFVSATNTFSIDIHALNSGIYFVRILSPNGIYQTKKLIKK